MSFAYSQCLDLGDMPSTGTLFIKNISSSPVLDMSLKLSDENTCNFSVLHSERGFKQNVIFLTSFSSIDL